MADDFSIYMRSQGSHLANLKDRKLELMIGSLAEANPYNSIYYNIIIHSVIIIYLFRTKCKHFLFRIFLLYIFRFL